MKKLKENKKKCPKCKSEDVECLDNLVDPFTLKPVKHKLYNCKQCGHVWKE